MQIGDRGARNPYKNPLQQPVVRNGGYRPRNKRLSFVQNIFGQSKSDQMFFKLFVTEHLARD